MFKLEMPRLSVAGNMPTKYREKCREQRAESREQRAESKEPRAVGGARREIKPTLQVVVGTDLYMALEIGTDTKTVKPGGPPGGAGGAMVPVEKWRTVALA